MSLKLSPSGQDPRGEDLVVSKSDPTVSLSIQRLLTDAFSFIGEDIRLRAASFHSGSANAELSAFSFVLTVPAIWSDGAKV